eukprot:COSAG02_NODE_5529_length_4252_cov_7.756080_5_plen_86_part_00
MGFRTRPGPRVEVIVVCLRSELLDEAVCSLPKTPKGIEGDGQVKSRSSSLSSMILLAERHLWRPRQGGPLYQAVGPPICRYIYID